MTKIKKVNLNLKTIILLLFDLLCFVLSTLISCGLFGDISLKECLDTKWYLLLSDILIIIILFFSLNLSSVQMKYFGIIDTLKICLISVVIFLFNFTLELAVLHGRIGLHIILALIFTTLVLFGRFSLRIFRLMERGLHINGKEYKNVLIIGAGEAGAMLAKEMRTSDKLFMRPICFLDDNEQKVGSTIENTLVVGTINRLLYYVNAYKIDIIIVAIPSANRQRLVETYELCKKTNCEIKTIPTTFDLMTGKVSISSLKKVRITDLLGRKQANINVEDIIGYIENKIVLVTGGGGSIGSELCRQIAQHNPKQLIIFDIYENNAYDVEQELKRHYPSLNLLTLIGSVRDSKKLDDLFDKYHPEIVFHAAAHKHVPLMETSPNEAVKNNVLGTYKVCKSADKYQAQKFVLISTDKAVNPTNIMGATKRICEMIIQMMNRQSKTDFVAVRFGNVLGSNGSVIPLFEKQIAEGGPVTVTDEKVERYFMTIQEAVALVLQAGAYAKGGEIFVLDMGEQVKIYDLAVNMIKLSGLEPNVDIDIKIVGLRPGEKLYEERLMKEEGLQKTANEMISIAKPIEMDDEWLKRKLEELYNEAYSEINNMKRIVSEIVPTYACPKE